MIGLSAAFFTSEALGLSCMVMSYLRHNKHVRVWMGRQAQVHACMHARVDMDARTRGRQEEC